MKRDIFYDGAIINKVGVDRIVLNKVILKRIDVPVFRGSLSSSFVRYDDTITYGRNFYRTENDVRFCFLKIEDNQLGTFTFGVKNGPYGIWQFSPKEMFNGLNLVNYSAQDIHIFIERVKSEMVNKYGLWLEYDMAEIREIELNTTFELECDFSSYRRVLAVMMSIMPYLKRDNTNGINDKKAVKKLISGQTVHNKQISMCVYNKSLEMELAIKDAGERIVYDENGVIVDGDLMRIEGKLKTPESVAKKFHGHNKLIELTDEIVCLVFEEIIDYYIYAPYRTWKEKNKAKLRKIVRDEIKNVRNWKNSVLEEVRNLEQRNAIPVLLEMEDLYEIIKEFPDSSRHVGRRMKGFKLRKDDVFASHDGQKYVEIMDTLDWIIKTTKKAFLEEQ